MPLTDDITTTITAVLLIPEEGDPLGLLAEGPCGARPPVMPSWSCDESGHPEVWRRRSDVMPPLCPLCSRRQRWPQHRALVLAWGGEVVAEGMDRFMRAIGCAPPRKHDSLKPLLSMIRAENADPQTGGLGTIVFLDADGHEVTP